MIGLPLTTGFPLLVIAIVEDASVATALMVFVAFVVVAVYSLVADEKTGSRETVPRDSAFNVASGVNSPLRTCTSLNQFAYTSGSVSSVVWAFTSCVLGSGMTVIFAVAVWGSVDSPIVALVSLGRSTCT